MTFSICVGLASQPTGEFLDFFITPDFFDIYIGKTSPNYRHMVISKFKELFPGGCIASQENIEKLLSNGMQLGHMIAFNIPITGRFVENGSEYWYLNGELHREGSPAIIERDGTRSWYRHGLLHREDGPAVELADGGKEWFLNGKRHRDDGPAREYANGSEAWSMNGELHREGSPALISVRGTKYWYLNGNLHRFDGPAIEWLDGTKSWYINGKFVKRTSASYA